MFKQLNRINQIDEESNQSQSQEEVNLNLSQETKERFQLLKIGQQETDNLQYDHQQTQGFIGFNSRSGNNGKKSRNSAEIDLESYLDLQRDHLNQGKAKVRRKPKTPEQIERQKQFIEGYGKGFKIAMKMGLNIGKGLGKNEQGRTNIVEAEFKTSLTKRDEDYEQEVEKKSQQSKQEQEFNQNKHEQLFNFRSRKYNINQLLTTLKSKYELSKSKVEVIRRNKQSIQRDKEYNTNLLLQKQNQVSVLNHQILGLASLTQNLQNMQQFPHLVIEYNIDFFVVKKAIEKLSSLRVNKIGNSLKQEIRRVRKMLNKLYIEKEKQSLKQYNEISGIEQKMQQFFRQNKQISNAKFNQQSSNQEPIQISQEDRRKIQNFIRLIIQETTIKNKLQIYLQDMKDFDSWQEWLIDLVDIIQKNDEESGKMIKNKFLIPKANSYLAHYRYQPQKKRLPHLVVFPWMVIIRLEQLNIQGFFTNLMSRIWQVERDDLYNIISPWIKHLSKRKSQQFIHFYLAPRLLYEMENCSLTERDSKEKIKGFLKYSELIPSNLRDEIIQNTLAIQLMGKYEEELKKESSSRKQLDEWVKKWVSKFDFNQEGLLKKYFTQNGYSSIWDC